jgi:prepilin-type processing-associated H-X9-DG protein
MSRKGASKTSVVACILAVLALSSLCGFVWPLELVFWVAVGWLPFLGRVASQIQADWNAVASAGAALTLFSLGLHLFLRWLASKIRPSDLWKPRWTAAIVAIILMMFVAGIATIGLSHQIAWLIKSDQRLFSTNLVREAAQRAQSANNLHSLAIVFHVYAEKYGAYPAGATIAEDGRALHGWQTLILPFIEQQPLYDKINLKIPWDDPTLRPPFAKEIKLYLLPDRDLPIRDGNGYALSHYAVNQHALGGSARRKRSDFPDGAANTLLIGEAAGNYKPWGNPTNWRDPAIGINTSPDGFGSPWTNRGAQFVFADGHTQFISEKTDAKVLRALATPNGGEPISAGDF